jgi:hypothetical protein
MSDEKGRRMKVARWNAVVVTGNQRSIVSILKQCFPLIKPRGKPASIADLCCCVVACYEMNRPRQGPIPDAAGGIVE